MDEFKKAVEAEVARLKAEAEKVVNSSVVHDTVAAFLADVISLLEKMVKGPDAVADQPPPPANV